MIHKLIFDTTDADTIQDSHSVGAYVRSSESGALVTNHSSIEAGTVTFDFVDGDVTVGTETIAETGHGLLTGDVVRLSNAGGALPSPLAAATDYFVIRVDADNFQLAASAKDAEAGLPLDIVSAAGGGTHTLTEQDSDRRALDVWMVNPLDVNITQADEITVFQGTDPWIVSATQLDIDDLNATDDAVQAWAHDGSGNAITSSGGALDVNIASSDISIDVDIQNGAEYAEDSAHSSADVGNYVLAVRADARPTDANTDADGDYASLFVNDSGELWVKDADTLAQLVTIDAVLDTIKTDTAALVVDLAAIEVELLDQGTTLDSILADTANIDTNIGSLDSTLTALSKAEDEAHVSGDQGIQALAVRNDTLAALAGTDGDYAPLQVDADGAMYVNVSNEISINDAALANTSIVAASNTLASANTAEDVVAAPLANRKYLFIYNNDNREMYLGGTGVSAASGFPIPPGSMLPLRAGAAVDIEWVSAKAGHDLRHMELS